MNKKSKVAAVLVFIIVILFGVGQFFAFSNISSNNQPASNQTAAPPSPPTQVVVYAPSAPASSTPVEDGSCFANSIAAPYRSDAWRCSVGNAITDPCFQISGSRNLLCGINPAEGSYATSTFVLHLTKALPTPTISAGAAPSNWAWAVQLEDGTYCTPFTGTRPFTASGTAAYYACSSLNPSESVIVGDLNASSSAWLAEVGSLNFSTSSLPTLQYSALVPVSTVWQ